MKKLLDLSFKLYFVLDVFLFLFFFAYLASMDLFIFPRCQPKLCLEVVKISFGFPSVSFWSTLHLVMKIILLGF